MANKRYLYLIEKLKKCGMKEGASIVDCGCGEGDGSEYLRDAGYDVHPFDVSQKMVNFCRKNKGIPATLGNILDMPVLDNFSDVFVCSETLEHIDKAHNTVAAINIKGVVKPGGYICITVPEDRYICLTNRKHKQYLSYEDIVKMFSLTVVFKGRFCKNDKKCNLVVIFKNE